MKQFLIKSLVFFSIVVAILSLVLVRYGGYVDYFYEKFTSPRASSLILGDSRSLQGIQPEVIKQYFNNTEVERPILNYSFTLKQIAYGRPYTESIKRKLDSTTKNGLFIISVHPFTLSNRTAQHEEEEGVFFEANMPPHNMRYVNNSPNYEYLFKNWDYFHFRGIIRKSSKTHKDGWLEETNLPDDKKLLQQWKQNQVSLYGGFSEKWKKSPVRMAHLEELCNYLNKHGEVFMLRMPIDDDLLQIENAYWENFDKDMDKLSKKLHVGYINFNTSENRFQTYDGIHIDKFAGVPFTENLCDSISSMLKARKYVLEDSKKDLDLDYE
ncbi:hypothetical protein WIW50_09650 [Flavobacteriaceae bacterium 3-367]